MTTTTDSATPAGAGAPDFKVADLSLADFGRKEIELAEHEMPGLMALRRAIRRRASRSPAPDHRLAAHDDPDRGAHRDAASSSAPRCAGRRATSSPPRTTPPPRSPARGVPGVRVEGRDARGVLVVHRAGAALARTVDGPEHDPRRRRRRHAARAQGRRVRARRRGARADATTTPRSGRSSSSCSRDSRRRPAALAPHRAKGSRASPRRRRPACTGCTRCRRRARCCSPRSTSTTP